MKIGTYNCNSVRSRLAHVLEWLEANEPDLLALQETKVTDDKFPVGDFEAAGWKVAYRGEKSYNGVALVSRESLSDVRFGLEDDDGQSESRLVAADLGGLHIVNTYVPQGRGLDHEMFTFKLEWFARLRAYFDRRFTSKQAKVVWVGDLNVAPEPEDVHDSKSIWPHVCHGQEVIDAFHGVTDFGLEDVFRKHLPDPGTFTFWDYRVKNALDRGLGWRIDHILATPRVAKTSTACTVDTEARRKEKPSDHTFVLAEFGE